MYRVSNTVAFCCNYTKMSFSRRGLTMKFLTTDFLFFSLNPTLVLFLNFAQIGFSANFSFILFCSFFFFSSFVCLPEIILVIVFDK